MSSREEYLIRSAMCQAHAETMHDPQAVLTYRRLADGWRDLAHIAQRQRPRPVAADVNDILLALAAESN